MDIDAEDAKLVTLAKASRARIGANAGAAVRDQDGRTYSAASIDRPSLSISALDLAVAMALSSGAARLEAAAVSCESDCEIDSQAARDLAQPGAVLVLASPSGELREVTSL